MIESDLILNDVIFEEVFEVGEMLWWVKFKWVLYVKN